MLKIPGKIPITIHPFFWVLACLLAWMNTNNPLGIVIWVLIILISVLVHEYGHALTALGFGQKVEIELVAFGGVTKRRGENNQEELSLWKEFIIIFNGPLAGFFLAGVAWWVQGMLKTSYPETLPVYIATTIFSVNIFWTVLNLIPVEPLDGGKLFSIVFQSLFGLKGKKIALFLSLVFSCLLGMLFFSMKALLLGSIFILFAFENYKLWKESLSLTEDDRDLRLKELLNLAEQQLIQGDNDQALGNFQKIRGMTNAGIIYRKALEYSARLLIQKGDFREAHRLLKGEEKNLNPDSLYLLMQTAFYLKNWEEVKALGDKVYRSNSIGNVALMNAISHAALGHVKESIGWLQCAKDEGVSQLKEIIDKEEFNRIRHDPFFESFMKKN